MMHCIIFSYVVLFVGVLYWSLLCYECHVLVLHHLEKEERDGCIAVIIFLMFCDCKCSVTLYLDAVGWSAVCECGFA